MKKRNRKKILLGIFIFFSFLFLTIASPRIYDSTRSLYSNIKLFSEVFDKINKYYVDEKAPEELIENAIKGMVSSLDPHTTYLTIDHFKKWSQSYEGYSGVGIYFDIIRDKITVMSVISGGPSEEIGLLPGDRIIAINKKSAIGMKREEVPFKLMGPKGTKVEVTVQRQGWKKPKNFVITRDEVHIQSVPYVFTIRSDVGYIYVVRFSSTTSDELENALQKLESQGIKKLILDLRANGGGYLDAAVKVANKFLPGGKKIVYTKGRIRNSFQEFFSIENSTHPLIPLIVLINRTSASASEIVAGALQDWDRALIVGETSFGKGLVQSQYRFPDGSALLMTTARYYTPAGRLIQRPYVDKSSKEYYSEIMEDSSRNDLNNDTSRPSFKTQILRREVFGGGGITPDIFFTASRDELDQVVQKIRYSPQRPFFTFVENYVEKHTELKRDFNHFLHNYKPNGKCLQKFLNHIRELGLKITNKEFVDNKEDIQFILKQFIAAKIWGNEARYKVQMLRDHQLLEALSYFSQAEDLLARAYLTLKN